MVDSTKFNYYKNIRKKCCISAIAEQSSGDGLILSFGLYRWKINSKEWGEKKKWNDVRDSRVKIWSCVSDAEPESGGSLGLCLSRGFMLAAQFDEGKDGEEALGANKTLVQRWSNEGPSWFIQRQRTVLVGYWCGVSQRGKKRQQMNTDWSGLQMEESTERWNCECVQDRVLKPNTSILIMAIWQMLLAQQLIYKQQEFYFQ